MLDILGLDLDQSALRWWHMLARAVVVYLFAIVLVRLGEKRFIGKSTAFDVLLAIMLGSVLSRAITGSSPFVPSLAASLGLVAMHFLLAAIAFRSHRFGGWIKGESRLLVSDGRILWDNMRKSHVSEGDLMLALRENGKTDDLARVRVARLERSGSISVLLRENE
ncbi:YetF domain-containing protein [Ramlibacter sp. AN1015]|uniref:DUF421 domain-containing protein n=1 Tax=Ramlibacter sp. AN1015 TaxID=3133428 RepID=UPI0030C1762D